MADEIEIAARLKQARKAAGFKSAREAAESLGVNYATYSQHENGTRGIVREAELYARRYRVSLDWLMRGKGDGPKVVVLAGRLADSNAAGVPASKRSKPNASFPPVFQRLSGDVSIPVLGQSEAGPNGRFILNGTEIARVFAPPGLENIPEAYAVQVFGTSMEPRFKAGETVWLNPRAPYRAGDDVVVQLLPENDGEPPASYIKEFRSKSAKVVRLLQHNPDEGETKELDFDADQVFSIHKVVHHAML